MDSAEVRRNYQVASLHAKLQAKTYENEMLKRLARHLVSQQLSFAHPPPAPSIKSAKVRKFNHIQHMTQIHNFCPSPHTCFVNFCSKPDLSRSRLKRLPILIVLHL